MPERHVDYLPLDEIVPAERNPKRHDGDGIRASIDRFGVGELPLVDERTGRLVAGHGRIDQLTAMRAAGQQPPEGIALDAEGRWLVPVTRGWASRSDVEARAYLLASNKLTFNGGWDDPELAELLAGLADEDPDLVGIAGFDAAELAELLGRDEEEGDGGSGGGHTDPDDVPGPPAKPRSAPGDLWLLGPHRLLCGDATNPDDLDRLTAGAVPGIIYTDPPYGISIVNDHGKVGHPVGMPFGGLKGDGKRIATTRYLPVAGDDGAQTAVDGFRLLHAAYPAAVHVWWGGNHYAGSAAVPDSSCWLVWDKDTNGDFADAELAWTNHPGAVRLLRHMWNGMLRVSERGKRVHPTQKPVALAVWAFGQVDPKGERRVVLDVFAGSGSTLIAAHQTDRTALLMEMEPAYVDVICRRWQEHTGTVPQRQLPDGTTEPHDFTAD